MATEIIREQMFFDGTSPSFLGDVIQIMKPIEIRMNIYEKSDRPNRSVRVTFKGYEPNERKNFNITKYGRSYGECLFKIRKEIREETGR